MSAERRVLGEPVFATAAVARLAGLSLRQLQWWDERKLVAPRKDERRRLYGRDQVLEILTVAALRRKGLSLQKIRRLLRPLRRESARVWSNPSDTYVVTDGKAVYLADQPQDVLARFLRARRPMYLVCLSEHARRIAAEQEPQYRTRQLSLFQD